MKLAVCARFSLTFSLAAMCFAATPLEITSKSLPVAVAGETYTASLGSSGGSGRAKWKAVGSVPSGLRVSDNGKIEWRPTEVELTPKFTVQVRDNAGTVKSHEFSINVVERLSIAPVSLPSGQENQNYTGPNLSRNVSGGSTPYIWSFDPGFSHPSTLHIDQETGVISGTAPADTYHLKLKVTDRNNEDSKPDSLTLLVPATLVIVPELSITTPAKLPRAAIGQAWAPQTLDAVGGTPTYKWKLQPGAPSWLSITGNTLVATPSTASAKPYSFKIQVSDSTNPPIQVSKEFHLSVAENLAITTTSLPGGTTYVPYPATKIDVVGGTRPYQWRIASGELPPGMTMDIKSGVISGTPDAVGNYSITVEVTDSTISTAEPPLSQTSQKLQIAIVARPSVTTVSLPNAVVGVPYPAQTLAASGGNPFPAAPSYHWSLVPGQSPPPDIHLDPSGTLSGTPSVAGRFPFKVQAMDATLPVAMSSTRDLTMIVRGSFHGHVYSQKGTPVEGATVEALNTASPIPAGFPAEQSTLTRRDGSFDLTLPAAVYNVSAWKPGYQRQDIDGITIQDTGTIRDFQLNLGAAGGEYYRLILGMQQSAASSTQAVGKLFADLYFDTPLNWAHAKEPEDRILGPVLRAWGNARIAGAPVASAVPISEFSLEAAATKLNTSEIAQSISFMLGPEVRLWGAGSVRQPSINQNNNSDGAPTTSRFTVSAIAEVGATVPLDPQLSANLVDPTKGDAKKLYEGLTGQSYCTAVITSACLDTSQYGALALVAKERKRFMTQWAAGVRLKTYYFTPAGIPANRPPAQFDISIGQNEQVTRGHLQGWVGRLEGFFPLPFQRANLNMVYLFGSAYLRLIGNPGIDDPYVLVSAPSGIHVGDAPGSANGVPAGAAPVILPPPDRDIYTIGIGLDLVPFLKHLLDK